jgi:hypothetical protein
MPILFRIPIWVTGARTLVMTLVMTRRRISKAGSAAAAAAFACCGSLGGAVAEMPRSRPLRGGLRVLKAQLFTSPNEISPSRRAMRMVQG